MSAIGLHEDRDDPALRHRQAERPRLVPTREVSTDLVLLTPGPVTTSPRVRQAMARHDIGHRDGAFCELFERVRAGLKRVADASGHDAVVLPGGGTGATEAALRSLVARPLLVVSNGFFGERIAEIARIVGLPVRHLRYDWGTPVDLADIARELDADPSIGFCALVHHETSVGRLNPLSEIAALLKGRGVDLVVDVISSLGAEMFSADALDAAVVVGSANKCLHGVPGVSFVLVRRDVWAKAPASCGSMYLDLKRYLAAAEETRQTPFTPAVPALVALDEAIRELESEGGVAARHARYAALNTRISAGLEALGFHSLLPESGASTSLALVRLPEGVAFAALYETLRHRGFVVYGTKGALADVAMIVGNMGALSDAMVDRFLAAVADAGEPGRAVAANS